MQYSIVNRDSEHPFRMQHHDAEADDNIEKATMQSPFSFPRGCNLSASTLALTLIELLAIRLSGIAAKSLVISLQGRGDWVLFASRNIYSCWIPACAGMTG
jgi:hypothetical protein